MCDDYYGTVLNAYRRFQRFAGRQRDALDTWYDIITTEGHPLAGPLADLVGVNILATRTRG